MGANAEHSQPFELPSWILPVLIVLIALATLGSIVTFVQRVGFKAFDIDDNSFPESAAVYLARRVAQGGSLYGSLEEPPFVPAQYGPLLYYPVGHLGRLLGPSEHTIRMIGRTLALFSTLVCLVVVAAVVRRRAGTALSVVCAGLFLAGGNMLMHVHTYRPDVPALALSLAGLYWASRGTSLRQQFPGLVVAVVAVFMKQSAVSATCAIVASAFLSCGWRRGTFLALVACLSGGLAILAFTVGTEGLFLTHVTGANRFPFSPGLAFVVLGEVWPYMALPFTCALVEVLQAIRHRNVTVFHLHFLIAFPLALAGCAKWGSNTYYFLEPFASGVVLSGYLFARLLGAQERRHARHVFTVILIAVLVPSVISLASSVHSIKTPWRWAANSASSERGRELLRLAEDLRRIPGPVYVTEGWPAVACGHEVISVDPMEIGMLIRNGIVPAERALGPIREGVYDMIVTSSRIDFKNPTYQGRPTWHPEMLEAVRGNYRYSESRAGFDLFVRVDR